MYFIDWSIRFSISFRNLPNLLDPLAEVNCSIVSSLLLELLGRISFPFRLGKSFIPMNHSLRFIPGNRKKRGTHYNKKMHIFLSKSPIGFHHNGGCISDTIGSGSLPHIPSFYLAELEGSGGEMGDPTPFLWLRISPTSFLNFAIRLEDMWPIEVTILCINDFQHSVDFLVLTTSDGVVSLNWIISVGIFSATYFVGFSKCQRWNGRVEATRAFHKFSWLYWYMM